MMTNPQVFKGNNMNNGRETKKQFEAMNYSYKLTSILYELNCSYSSRVYHPVQSSNSVAENQSERAY